MATESTLMSIREAARRLGVHDNTVRRYADRGLLRVVRLPSGVRRVRRADVEALEPPHSTAPPPPADGRRLERTLSQLVADQGGHEVRSLDELVSSDIWHSDEEAAEFLKLTYAERDRHR